MFCFVLFVILYISGILWISDKDSAEMLVQWGWQIETEVMKPLRILKTQETSKIAVICVSYSVHPQQSVLYGRAYVHEIKYRKTH